MAFALALFFDIEQVFVGWDVGKDLFKIRKITLFADSEQVFAYRELVSLVAFNWLLESD